MATSKIRDKPLKETLHQSEEHIKQLVANSPIAMVVTSGLEQKVLLVNKKFTELFGYLIEDIPDVSHWWPLAYPDEKYRDQLESEWTKRVDRAIKTLSEIEPMEARVTCKDGSTRDIEFHLSSIGERNIVTFIDLTKRKQAEELLRRTHDELEEKVRQRTAQLFKANAALVARITERNQAENALQISEEKYRTIADFTYDWEDWIGPSGKYVYVSPSSARITGYAPEDFLADPELVIKITHPDDRDLVQKHFREILSGGPAIHHIDFCIVTRDGERRWISRFCQPVHGKDGNFLGRRGSNRDITKRIKTLEALRQLTNDMERYNAELKIVNNELETEIGVRIKTEKALRESEERYKKMVDAVTTYTYSVDLDQRGAMSTMHSVGCFPVTGYAPEDYEGDPYLWHTMIYLDDKIMVENSIKEILEGHKVHPIEHRIIRRDDKVIWVRNTIVPFYDDEGRLIRYDGLIEDISERKKAEEEILKLNRELEQKVLELTEANRALDAFNYTVSHDLQTPVVVIGGYIGRFLKVCGDKIDSQERYMLNTVQLSAQKMERLIKDLLLFSRVRKQEIKSAEIDMQHLIMTALTELKTLSNDRTIKFDVKVLPRGYGDVTLINQVFINLLSNAIKFTRQKEEAVIEVGGTIKDGENIYYVQDNGIGFDSRYADELFFPFRRLHAAEDFEGTGVGLSIVQRIINLHGGRVWAVGKVNEGAIFFFSLPNRVPQKL